MYYYDKSDPNVELFESISDSVIHIGTNKKNTNALIFTSLDKLSMYVTISGSNDAPDFISNLEIEQRYPRL